MADKRIIQLPDTPGLDTATDEMVVDNAADGARRVPVGRAGGPPILDAAGKITDRLAYEGAAGGVATLDADGRLVQPVFGQLRLHGTWTNTSDESTTDAVGNPVSGLKSSAISLTAGDVAVVNYGGLLSNYGAGWAFIRPLVSEDGGATWTAVGTYSGVYTPDSTVRVHAANNLIYVADADKSVIFGVSYGNASGVSDEIHWMSYKFLTLLVFRGASG